MDLASERDEDNKTFREGFFCRESGETCRQIYYDSISLTEGPKG